MKAALRRMDQTKAQHAGKAQENAGAGVRLAALASEASWFVELSLRRERQSSFLWTIMWNLRSDNILDTYLIPFLGDANPSGAVF